MFGERLDVCQSHAARGAAVTVVLRRVAGAEDLAQAAQRDGAARIRDLEVEVTAHALHGDGNAASLMDGLDGVGREVVEDGQDRVGVELRQPCGHICREFDALVELARVFLLRVDDQAADLGR